MKEAHLWQQGQPTLQADETSNPGETTPLARTAGTCRSLLRSMKAVWTFLIHPALEPTNNASGQALRSAVIGRKMSFGDKSEWGGQLVARLLTVTTGLEQQGRDAMASPWS